MFMDKQLMNTQIRRLIIVAWVGGLWAVGLLVAPVLFTSLPRMTAGMVAGRLFTAMAWIGIISSLLILTSYYLEYGFRAFKRLAGYVVLVMLLCVLISHFGITPAIEELKRVANDANNERLLGIDFVFWHAVSSIVYYVLCALGVILVFSDTGKISFKKAMRTAV